MKRDGAGQPGADAPARPSVKTYEALTGAAGPEGLRWMLRGPYHRRHIRAGLAALVDGATIGPCRLYRAKFKPGRKLTAYVEARVDAPTSRSERHVAVTWTMGDLGDGRVDGAVRRMQDEAIRSGVASPFAALRAEIPAAGMRLEVSPLDVDHPQLVRVSSPEHIGEVLADAGWGSGSIRVTTIRYRPRQRHVLRYDAAGEDGTLYGKLYRRGEARAAFDLAAAIADRLGEMRCPITAARPFAVVEDDDLVLYEAIAGTSVARRITAGAEVGPALNTAGRALRILQAIPAPELGPVPTFSLEAEIAAIARAAEHVRALEPSVGARIGHILERASEVAGRLAPEEPAFAHGDYKCDHLIADRGKITLIDFNTCSVGDPALDVGKFLADLEWWFASSGRSWARAAKRTFLDGYGDGIPAERLLRARVYEVLILTKITVHRVPLFDPGWAGATGRLIGRADALLRGLETAARRGGRERTWAPPSPDRTERDAG